MTANHGIPTMLFIHGRNMKEEIAESDYFA